MTFPRLTSASGEGDFKRTDIVHEVHDVEPANDVEDVHLVHQVRDGNCVM